MALRLVYTPIKPRLGPGTLTPSLHPPWQMARGYGWDGTVAVRDCALLSTALTTIAVPPQYLSETYEREMGAKALTPTSCAGPYLLQCQHPPELPHAGHIGEVEAQQ